MSKSPRPPKRPPPLPPHLIRPSPSERPTPVYAGDPEQREGFYAAIFELARAINDLSADPKLDQIPYATLRTVGASLAEAYVGLARHPDVPYDAWAKRQAPQIAMALFVARGSVLSG